MKGTPILTTAPRPKADQQPNHPSGPGHAARRWAGRFLAAALGLLLLAVGVGLGPRHYAAQGISSLAVPGFVLIILGVALSGWSAWRILRSTRRRWWVAVVALLSLATYLILWTLGQAVAASYAPRPTLGEQTPADVGVSYRDVTFSSSDGVELAGWYVPTRDGAAVALMHGAGSTRSAVLAHAAVLSKHGYGVLLFDARGHGESAGRGMEFGWYGEADAAGAVDFLTSQPGVDPRRIGLVGMSMGGEQAIGAAGEDDRVAAVVAEGATNRVADDKDYLAAYGARGEAQQRIDAVTYWFTALLSDAPEPAPLRESISIATTRPDPTAFLLITASQEPDEALASDHMQGPADDLVTTWSVPGAGHTRGLREAPADWEDRVVTFLDDALEG